jgi:hemerythrin
MDTEPRRGRRADRQQHKELFSRINALLEGMKSGQGPAEISKTMRFLGDYVVLHFGTEEKEMAKHTYPASQSHKAEHEAFVRDLGALNKEDETQGANAYLTIQIQRRVCDWLVSHIGRVDKVLGAYLQSQAA